MPLVACISRLATCLSGPRVHSSVERRDPQRFPSVVSNPRRHEPQSPQQIRRRHGRPDDHREPADNAARPEQQRLLDAPRSAAPTVKYSLPAGGRAGDRERVNMQRLHVRARTFACNVGEFFVVVIFLRSHD